MEQHAVPRQITTFEFKLIGFFTLKQFGYLVFFSPISFILFSVVPIPFLNIILAALAAIAGIVIVFVPYNDRPIDIWVKNFIRQLFSPSQYYFIKHNQIPDFLRDVVVYAADDVIEKHVDARQKLHSYLATTPQEVNNHVQKQHINELIVNSGQQPIAQTVVQAINPDDDIAQVIQQPVAQLEPVMPTIKNPPQVSQKPFLFGVVKNNKNIPLPQILIYIKDSSGSLLRILKTNHNGVFATYHSLPENTYIFEIKDLGQKYFFDTMDVSVKKINDVAIEFFSKEIL